MEDPLDALAGRVDCRRVRNIRLDDLARRIARMLLKIGAAAHDKTVEHAYAPSASNQTVDQMAADEAGAARHQIQRHTPGRPAYMTVHTAVHPR